MRRVVELRVDTLYTVGGERVSVGGGLGGRSEQGVWVGGFGVVCRPVAGYGSCSGLIEITSCAF